MPEQEEARWRRAAHLLAAAVLASAFAIVPGGAPNGWLKLGIAGALVAAASAQAPRIAWSRVDALAGALVLGSFAAGAIDAGPGRAAYALASYVVAWTAARVAGAMPDEHRSRVFGAVALTAVAIGAIAVAECAGLALPWAQERRPQSVLGNRNFVAQYAAVALPFVLARSRGDARSAAMLGCAVLGYVLVVCRCRAAWLALAAAAAAYVACRGLSEVARSKEKLAALAGGGALGFAPTALAFRVGIGDAAARIADATSGSGHGRLVQHRIGFELLRRAPFVGHGPGAWGMDREAGAGPSRGPMPTTRRGPDLRPGPGNLHALRLLLDALSVRARSRLRALAGE